MDSRGRLSDLATRASEVPLPDVLARGTVRVGARLTVDSLHDLVGLWRPGAARVLRISGAGPCFSAWTGRAGSSLRVHYRFRK